MFVPEKTTAAEVRYVDVVYSGSVQARGQGRPAALGHLRNADELVHVVRTFETT